MVSNKQDGEAFIQQLVILSNGKVNSGTETKGEAKRKGKRLGSSLYYNPSLKKFSANVAFTLSACVFLKGFLRN